MIANIQRAFKIGRYEYSRHAVEQSVHRHITDDEICEAIESGEVIEDYPDGKYGPSCLILGRTLSGRPIHIQCTYPERPRVKIITVYEPKPDEWIACRTRRSL